MNTGTLESTTHTTDRREVRSQVSRAGQRVKATISNEHGDVISASIDERGVVEVLVTTPGRAEGAAKRIYVPAREVPRAAR